MKIIEIIVSPAGQTRLETKGFAGTACRGASQFLEAALGAPVSEQRTAEFYSDRAVTTQAASTSHHA